jgi:hypothetical protein
VNIPRIANWGWFKVADHYDSFREIKMCVDMREIVAVQPIDENHSQIILRCGAQIILKESIPHICDMMSAVMG